MTDEEKEAIEIIKFLQEKCMLENGRGTMPIYRIDDLANAIETLLNLIEKQSKEIEKLREEKAKRQWVHIKENGEVEPLFYVSKNEIKAKIEDILNSENSEAIEKLIEWQAHLEKDFPTTITKEELEKRWEE